MLAQRYTVVPGRRGRVNTWRLLDETGTVRGEVSHPDLLPDLIEARHMAAVLEAVCAKTGLLIANHARYQCAEDEFDEFGN